MPPLQHAMLSASSAHRWLECPPSAMLERELPDETTIYAAEGSVAHEVAEYKVRRYLGEENQSVPATGDFDSAEIDRHTDSYLYYVIDKIEEIRKSCPDAQVLVEQRLDYSNYADGGFGTGDLVIVADDVIHVIDFKYGKGVAVSAADNPQMKLYALGALNLYDFLYDIKTVRMSIVQPRISNISEWEISSDELINWTENTLKPIAALAARCEGEFKASEHCRFCKLKSTCRKRAGHMLELAKHPLPDSMSDKELARILYPSKAKKPQFKMPDYEYVHKELQKSGVTLNLLWLEYCEKCLANGEVPYQSTQFNKYYNDFLAKKSVTMHLNHKPGEIMQVDWAGDTAAVIDTDTGEVIKAYVSDHPLQDKISER